MRRTLRNQSGLGKPPATGMKRDSSNPNGSLSRVKSPELALGSENYTTNNLRLSIQSPNAAGSNTSMNRIEQQNTSANP